MNCRPKEAHKASCRVAYNVVAWLPGKSIQRSKTEASEQWTSYVVHKLAPQCGQELVYY